MRIHRCKSSPLGLEWKYQTCCPSHRYRNHQFGIEWQPTVYWLCGQRCGCHWSCHGRQWTWYARCLVWSESVVYPFLGRMREGVTQAPNSLLSCTSLAEYSQLAWRSIFFRFWRWMGRLWCRPRTWTWSRGRSWQRCSLKQCSCSLSTISWDSWSEPYCSHLCKSKGWKEGSWSRRDPRGRFCTFSLPGTQTSSSSAWIWPLGWPSLTRARGHRAYILASPGNYSPER